jgi:K+-sensing histidine kinase KdpD
MAGLALTGSKERLAAFGAAGRVVVHSMRLLIRRHGSLPRSLYVATGGVVAALLLSLFLSRVAHFPLPVSAQVPFYIAIFLAARTGGLLAGIAAFALALGASDFFLTEPIYDPFVVYDIPDFLAFGLAAGGSVAVGLLGRKMAGGASQ